MSQYTRQFDGRRTYYFVRVIPLLLIILTLACSLPSFGGPDSDETAPAPSPTLPPEPTPTPQALPPDLVESQPMPGSEVPLEGPITLYFNQSMDRASVESALVTQLKVEINFTWVNDSTVVLYPSEPLGPDVEFALGLGTETRSSQGMGMIQPISLDYRTAGYLLLVQALPEPDAGDVDPSSAIVAAFNRPIVALGSDPASLPAAFSLDPPAQGRGEWTNTSTYIFYPEPALAGGMQYTVQIDKDLKSVEGSPLDDAQSWSFTTAMPRLVSIEPVTEIPWPLDPEVVLTFNQPMDPASVEANFNLVGLESAALPGTVTWDDEDTVFTFTPDALLTRNTSYVVSLSAAAQARGGTPLGEDLSASVATVPALEIYNTLPAQGGQLEAYDSPALFFSAPIQAEDVLQYIRIDPAVRDLQEWWDEGQGALYLYGDFDPSTAYTLRVAPNLPDIWGGALGQEYQLAFNSAPLPPGITILPYSDVIFLTPQDPSLVAQAANLSNLPITMGSVPLSDFFTMLGFNGYDVRSTYQSADQVSWAQPLNLEPNRMQAVEVFVRPDQKPLPPGLYFIRFDLNLENLPAGPNLVAVSNMQVTYKVSATDALVWVVDLRSGEPLGNAPVTIYDMNGAELASGQADPEGVFYTTISPRENPYDITYAVVGQPGDDIFGLALSSWEQGITPWEFGLSTNYTSPGLITYFYTDRPIYRPGQTVFFRAVVRQAFNGRYELPSLGSLPLAILGPEGQELAKFDLPLSPYGTANAEYTLSPDAQPGSYALISEEMPNSGLNFSVADYRKPEINLQVSFESEQILAGSDLMAAVEALYFFGAPAGNVDLHWALYAAPSYFSLPGYSVGRVDDGWLDAFFIPDYMGLLGELVSEGEAQTGPDGTLVLQFPTEPGESRRQYSLEVTATDESGLPVSARSSAVANPASFYIGLRPDTWVGRAGEETGFDVQVVDWESEPAGAHQLRAEFKQVTWKREDPPPGRPELQPEFIPQYTEIASTDFSSDDQGRARLSFTPPEPGTYQLDVSGTEPANRSAVTELLLWVGGPGQAVWPDLPNSRLQLTADKEAYLPGDTAQVFIPNPFGSDALALATIERGVVMDHRVMRVAAGGQALELPLGSQEAPNVYLSVTLLGRDEMGHPDFRQGYTNLVVEPLEQTLQVTLTSQPEQTGPGDEVTFDLRVTDAAGNPVQGEFSLSVVDLAALALADPNAPDIVSAFYGEQPLGVRTSASLAAYANRTMFLPLGMGGGGGEAALAVVREDFPDTAYWNAEIFTDSDGRVQISIHLPDNLTSWQVDARGVTADTIVGQAEGEIIITKDLLVRPVTPRFLVVNDHVQLAAIVQNNTQNNLQTEVSLQANGVSLDDPGMATQQVNVPAGGRVRVDWWGTVQDVEAADLVFAAQAVTAGGQSLEDAARPVLGALPVLRYVARQTSRTSGTLDDPGEVLELVSLPRSFDAQNGELEVELAPSLAAATLNALQVLEHSPYESAEQTVSRFLPNLEIFRVLQEFGLELPGQQEDLNRALNEGLQRLQASQNPDGGWSWWSGGESDAYITAYVLFGLSRAQDAGISVNTEVVRRAVEYLRSADPSPAQGQMDSGLPPGQSNMDSLAFQNFALASFGAGDLDQSLSLYQIRDQLSPWAQAVVALTLEQLSPGSPEARTLVSDLESAAERSATGVHWELEQSEEALRAARQNMQTTLSNSAIVVYALAQRDPGSPLLSDAVRYLMAHRGAQGAWSTTYSTAWTLMGLAEVMRGTGELGGDFAFVAALNGNPLAEGQADGAQQLTPVTAQVPVQRLYADYPNALVIQRDPGPGRLYYTAGLNVSRPVEDVEPLTQGLSVERVYYPTGDACPDDDCEPIQAAQAGDRVQVRLTLTLPRDMYYLVVEDYIPAGAEILDTRLKTTQIGEGEAPIVETVYDPHNPLGEGWGWWLFNPFQIYDDHITWSANFLPAGTYELTYSLTLLQPGEFHVLPAHAWQFYFPEVQANSAGQVFEINP